jgi:hypothetical protein
LQKLVAIGLIVLESCTVLAQSGSQSNEPSIAEPQGGSLQLTLTQETSGPRFRAALQNAGDQPLILNLGIMLANGRKQYADRINLLLTDPRGKLLHLAMMAPGSIAGRVDPMVVPLPAGATFTVPIDLADYFAPKEKIWKLDLTPGRYTLSAEYAGFGVPQRAANLDMQGISLMPYWTGTVNSRTLPFTLTRATGRQPGQ